MTKRRIWTNEESEFLIKNFSILGTTKCAKILNRSEQIVKTYANKLKLEYRRIFQLDEKSKLWIRENYAMIGSKKCAEFLNVKQEAVKAFTRKESIKLLPETKTAILQQGHIKDFSIMNVNPNQFFNIQTPEVAYILGLLWADGYVHKKSVVCRIISSDMNDVKNIFFLTGKWNEYLVELPNRQGAITLHLGNTIISKYLLDHGYKSKSSLSACQILSKIPTHLKHYWFRGYFDGDGCILNLPKGGYAIKISSSYEQSWIFMENLFQLMNIKYKIRLEEYWSKTSKKWYKSSSINVNYADGVMKFLEFIYTDYNLDHYGLTRKYLQFCQYQQRAYKFLHKNIN